MSKDKIIRALGNVDDQFIDEASGRETLDESRLEDVRPEPIRPEADRPEAVRRRKTRPEQSTEKTAIIHWMKWAGPVAAVLAIAIGVATFGGLGARKASAPAFSASTTTAAASGAAAKDSDEAPGESAYDKCETLGLPEEEILLLADGITGEESQVEDQQAADSRTEEKSEAAIAVDPRADLVTSCIPEMPVLTADNSSAEGCGAAMDGFAENAACVFLAGSEDNKIYSPSNIYMALAMLAEITDGNTRRQILNALDADDMNDLRNKAELLWNRSNTDDGQSLVLTGNSLWSSNTFDFNRQIFEYLADKYHAYSYTGTMGSDAMNKLYRQWLSDRTKGLLDSYVSEAGLDPDSILSLVSTIYYKSPWVSAFDKTCNETADFYGSRKTTSTTFMTDTSTGVYYQDSQKTFTAVSKDLYEGTMWFILPEEGHQADDVLASEDLYELLTAPCDNDCTASFAQIHMAIPKFDLSCSIDLTEGLKALGITDAFVGGQADFSPLTATDGCFIGTAEHTVRLVVDEEGVEAAACTNIDVCVTAITTAEYEFRADRPFIYVLTNDDGLILFQGVVNNIE